MSETLYSIKESTLTDIGDALRRRHGETRIETVIVEEVLPDVMVVKTPNATGFGVYNGSVSNYAQTVKKNGANKIVIDLGYSSNGLYPLYMVKGEYNVENFPIDDATKYMTGGLAKRETFTFENTDSVTLCYGLHGNGSGYFYGECVAYDENGDRIGSQTVQVEKEMEVKNTYGSDEMAQAIDDIEVGDSLPEEALVLRGNCAYRFAYGGWNWFMNTYGNKIQTNQVQSCFHMFDSSNVESIPFEINYDPTLPSYNLGYMFTNNINLCSLPKLNSCKADSMESIFSGCYRLTNLPEDMAEWFDWSYADSQTNGYSCSRAGMFQRCYSLRSIPMDFLAHGNPVAAYSYTYLYNGFNYCYSLDELIDLPIFYTATYTSNIFNGTFFHCSRLKNITFAMPDGQPYIMKWKSQVIDLSSNVGYVQSPTYITQYNSGITADKEVKDDATYQSLKDDPDWFTALPGYSRYDKLSAIATINSLPDTSAYLATAGGTNTIKFKGAAGSATDGGAINTMTEAEIAVATARGWTVTFA